MMKSLLILAGCIIVGVIFLVTPGSSAPDLSTKVCWEYHQLGPVASEAKLQELNKLGEQGWELVAVEYPTPVRRYTYYFKRRCRKE